MWKHTHQYATCMLTHSLKNQHGMAQFYRFASPCKEGMFENGKNDADWITDPRKSRLAHRVRSFVEAEGIMTEEGDHGSSLEE